MFDPGTGRFLQRDPLGRASGRNPYTYVENRPASLVDELGLMAVPSYPVPPNSSQDTPLPGPTSGPSIAALNTAASTFVGAAVGTAFTPPPPALPQSQTQPTTRPSGTACCGPDVTGWLIAQMNTNSNDPVIAAMRNRRNWPFNRFLQNWGFVPVLWEFAAGWELGWMVQEYPAFAYLVKAGGVWDFKARQTFNRPPCPSPTCLKTVTLCGICLTNGVAGNIHFGFVGRAGGIPRFDLRTGAAWAQSGFLFTDKPHDVVGIDIGMDMYDLRISLCGQVAAKAAQLQDPLIPTGSCSPCSTKW